MSQLPPGWALTTVGEIGEYINGRGFRKSEWAEFGRPIIRIQNLTGSGSTFNYFGGTLEDRYVVPTGALLVSWAATLGVYRWKGPEGALNQHIFRVHSYIDEDFHRYALDHALAEMQRHTHGSGMVHITRGLFDSAEIALPPLAEQARIVVAIEESLSKLAVADAGLSAVGVQLRTMRESVLAAAITGRLVPQDDTEVNSIVLRQWSSSKEDPFTSEKLPEIPSSWRWCRAAAVCEAVESGSTPPAENMSQGGGDVPFIKVYNLTMRGVVDFTVNPTFIDHRTHQRQRRSAAVPGDVLTNIVGPPLGKVGVVPPDFPSWNMNQAVVMFRPSVGLRSEFLALALQTRQVLGRLAATARATAGQFNVSLTACRYLPIPVPPLSEQDRIVAEVERQLSFIESAERSIDSALARSEALRRSILKAAFEGRLVPQDPSDQPASALLERIRAESVSTDGSGGRRRSKKVGQP